MGIVTGRTSATPTTTKGGREAESAERVKEATACRNSPCPQNDGGVCIVEREECQRRDEAWI